VLFATVALARKLGVDAESALRRTTRGFAERYERFNELLRERGQSLDELSEAEIRSLFRQARA
jgi:tetrapyrrole methylase family protein/MazG family protein